MLAAAARGDLMEPAPLDLLVCIYTCEQHRHFLDALYDSIVGRYLRELPGARLIEVYADRNISRSVHHDGKLTVRAPESYETLSIKTLEMIRYCVAHFDFRRLLKIDGTIARTKFEGPQYEGRTPVDLEALADFLKNASLDRDYDGFLMHAQATRENVIAWARKKGGTIDYERLFGDRPLPPFFSGGCYLLSGRFARFVSENGGLVAKQHVDYLLGAEDVMIGRLYRDFQPHD